jgi:hypothetical protein
VIDEVLSVSWRCRVAGWRGCRVPARPVTRCSTIAAGAAAARRCSASARTGGSSRLLG